jgi:hypothetical protein
MNPAENGRQYINESAGKASKSSKDKPIAITARRRQRMQHQGQKATQHG